MTCGGRHFEDLDIGSGKLRKKGNVIHGINVDGTPIGGSNMFNWDSEMW